MVADLANWLSNSSPPWSSYLMLMACKLVALEKHLYVRTVGIRETLERALENLVLRAVGDQKKVPCINLQLCTGLEERIEGTIHDVWHLKERRTTDQGQEAGESEDRTDPGGTTKNGGRCRQANSGTPETAGRGRDGGRHGGSIG